jgi:hypothetical protein
MLIWAPKNYEKESGYGLDLDLQTISLGEFTAIILENNVQENIG